MKKMICFLLCTAAAYGLQAQAPPFQWARSTDGNCQTVSVAADALNNVYVLGSFTGTVDFDPGPGIYNLSASGSPALFIQKLDASGAFQWAKMIKGNLGNEISPYDMTVDAAGNVYTAGSYWDTKDFDPGPGVYNLTANGSRDMFLSKLDANGNFMWARSIGGAGSDEALSITADAAGNVYTTGYFYNTVDFDPGPVAFSLSAGAGAANFILKTGSQGDFLWVKSLGGPSGSATGNAIAVDAGGNVYTTGFFDHTVDFDPGPAVYNLAMTGINNDLFISKLDPDGNFLWGKGIGGGNSSSSGFDILSGPDGKVYITGSTGTADIADPEGPGAYMYFMSALDASGNFAWTANLGDNFSGSAAPQSAVMAIDASGRLYNRMAGLKAYDNTGALLWSDDMSGPSSSAIAVYATGDICAAGSFSGTRDFDPGSGTYTMTASGSQSAYVLRLSSIVPLPVTWQALYAGCNAGKADLRWSADAGGNSSFIVQRSSDGAIFEEVGQVAGAGLPGMADYHFSDEAPLSGYAYYRLQLISDHGTAVYSQVMTMECMQASEAQIVPNPCSGYFKVLGLQGEADLSLMDIAGKEVYHARIPGSVANVQLPWLQPGLYWARIRQAGQNRVYKVVLR